MSSFSLPNLSELNQAAALIYQTLPATPQYHWPLLSRALQAEVWLKHENHTVVGAFKVRGGLVYVDELMQDLERRQQRQGFPGLISATRGNHGQSLAFAAARYGVPVNIVVPVGNSKEKNAAMRALGAELIEYGMEFQESREYAQFLAQQQGWHLVPSLHPALVKGVASYWLEFFKAQPELDLVIVPIGMGSGIVAAIAARNALGLKTRIIGVVSSHAPAYQLSFAQRKIVSADVSTQLADGMACRLPDQAALDHILAHTDEILAVSDEEIAQAMKLLFCATHNLAEGAGAAALAAAWQQRQRWQGKRLGLPVTGANVDHEVYGKVLAQAETIPLI